MNPLTNVKNVMKLSENELRNSNKTSWHDMYKDSAWIFVGGLPYDLTEGDIICVFSQYGEIVNINLIRDKITGKQKGFCFICYEDQRSTILSVDNLNGMKILDRTIRVDHVADYKVPKENDKTDDETRRLYMEGCAPKLQTQPNRIKKASKNKTRHSDDVDDKRLPSRSPIDRIKTELKDVKQEKDINMKNLKKEKRDKRKKEMKKIRKEKIFKKKRKRSSSLSSSSSDTSLDSPDSDNVNKARMKKKISKRDKSNKSIDNRHKKY